MKRSKRLGFTLVELLVVITIIGTLMSLLLPAVQQARESARGLGCRNNMSNLAKGLILYENTEEHYPGYVESIGNDPTKANQQLRGSWVVAIFPYIEEQAAYDSWKEQHVPLAPGVQILNCHSDPPEFTEAPTLSYVVNSGRSPGDTGPIPDGMTPPRTQENLADGMFFDRSCLPTPMSGNRGAPQPRDLRHQSTGCVMLEMSARYLDSHDGNSKTVMISENVHAQFYVYANESGGFDNSYRDDKQYFGFVWSNQPGPIERINGDNENVLTMRQLDYSHAWPSSRHPGYVNVAFADGHVDKMEETVDPVVYRQMMTTRDRASLNISRGTITN
jgi:prepilin-type processing-associated H-X9-DG protein/prepilin-type N-terminal cleavage/methylation domain-containing protein